MSEVAAARENRSLDVRLLETFGNSRTEKQICARRCVFMKRKPNIYRKFWTKRVLRVGLFTERLKYFRVPSISIELAIWRKLFYFLTKSRICSGCQTFFKIFASLFSPLSVLTRNMLHSRWCFLTTIRRAKNKLAFLGFPEKRCGCCDMIWMSVDGECGGSLTSDFGEDETISVRLTSSLMSDMTSCCSNTDALMSRYVAPRFSMVIYEI